MEQTEKDTRSLPEVTVHTVILALSTVLALGGNSLICLAFFRNGRLRTITNHFVLSLAVADMMMALFEFPFGTVASGLRRWPFGYNFCQFSGFIAISWCQISTVILTFASINRYYCVVKPHRYSTLFSRKKTIFSIVTAWTFSFLLILFLFTANVTYQWSPKILFCKATFPDKRTERIYYLLFGCLFFVPILLTVFCYSRVYRVIRQHNNAVVPSLIEQNRQGIGARREIKASRVLFAAVLGFCVCWALFIVMVILEYGFQMFISSSTHSISLLITSFSAWINPIIYGIMNRAMRKELLNIFFCTKD